MTGVVGADASALEGLTAIDGIVTHSARIYRDRPALWVAGRFWTYGELHAAASSLSGALAANGGVRQCGVLAARSFAAFTGVLGALLAGAAYVPLNPRHPPDRVMAALLASDADAVVVDTAAMASAEAVLPACPRPLRLFFPDAAGPPDWLQDTPHRAACRAEISQSRPAAVRRDGPGAPAYLLFTSGSTGAPKGVLIRHANVLAYLATALDRWRPRASDRFTQLFDLSFDLSVHDMFVCWAAGACLYCPPPAALAGPAEFVRRHALTFWFSVPSTVALMDRLRLLEPGAFPSLRLSLFCGEALPPGLAWKWIRAAPDSIVENLYGPTEATIAVTAHRLDLRTLGRWATVPIGRPFPGQEAIVIDTNGTPLPYGEPGELCVGGSQVADGYWRRPDATAARFLPPSGRAARGMRWYRTGDRVVRDAEAGLIFLGRMDRQVKVRGYRVELQEVEAVLRGAAGTDSVAAIAWPPDPAAPARAVVAFIAGEERPAAHLVAACRRKLPAAVVPQQIRFLQDWPLNANGKTDYAALMRLMDVLDAGQAEDENAEGLVAPAEK